MKHLIPTLALILFLNASAQAQEFSICSIDIPRGWNAMEEKGVVAITAPGNEAALSIASDTMENLSADVVAGAFAKKLGGSEPKADEKGVYSFSFTRDGVKSTCFCSLREGEFLLVTVTDPTGRHTATIKNMLATLKMK